MANESFHLKIASREGVIYDGDVQSVSSYNEDGKFDILAEHANFISLLKKEITYVDTYGNTKKLDIDSGLLRMRNREAEIYLGVKSFVDESKQEAGEIKLANNN